MKPDFNPLILSLAVAIVLKLIEGLRQGTPVRLDDNPQSPTVTSSSATGYGTVFIILALSQASLTQSGRDRLETSLKTKDSREKGSAARTDHAPRAAKSERLDKPERGQRP